MKLKQIPEGTVVHTPTEEEAKELLAILHENGWNVHEPLDHVISEAKGISIYPKPHWGWWENINNAKLGGNTILTLAEFKEKYVEEENPRPKFKEGDMAFFPKRDKPMRIHDIKEGVAMSWWNNGGIRAAACLEDLKPYTEPETNIPKSVGLKTETKPTEDMETKEEKSENPINLCELLRDCEEGERFYSLLYGETQLRKVGHECIDIFTSDGEYWTSISSDGTFADGGQVVLFPSRALYEQYPLDAAKAWMKWWEEQLKCKMYLMIEDECNENLYADSFIFHTPADRDKCIEEIKKIIEGYAR